MATLKAGRNVWMSSTGETVKSDVRPGYMWYPLYNERRVTGDSYLPYPGNSVWERQANAMMRSDAQSNFARKNSF